MGPADRVAAALDGAELTGAELDGAELAGAALVVSGPALTDAVSEHPVATTTAASDARASPRVRTVRMSSSRVLEQLFQCAPGSASGHAGRSPEGRMSCFRP